MLKTSTFAYFVWVMQLKVQKLKNNRTPENSTSGKPRSQ